MNKIYKYMTAISRKVYIDNELMNTKMYMIEQPKSSDFKSSRYIEFDSEDNDKDPKFEIVDHVRILKYKNIFAKVY